MQFPDAIFWLIVLVMISYFGFNVYRRGGFKAAFFNAEISGTVGEIETTSVKFMTQRIKVHKLQRDSEKLVGIEIVSKTVGSYEMLPLALTQEQTQQLSVLLLRALENHEQRAG